MDVFISMTAATIEQPTGQRFRTLADSLPGERIPITGTSSSRQRQASLPREDPAMQLQTHYGPFEELSEEQQEYALEWALYAQENDVTNTPPFQHIQRIENRMHSVPYVLRRFFFRDITYEDRMQALHRQRQQEKQQQRQERLEVKRFISSWGKASIPRPHLSSQIGSAPQTPWAPEAVGTYGFAFQMDARQAAPTRHSEPELPRVIPVTLSAPIYPQTAGEIKAYAASIYKRNHPDDFRTSHEITAMLFPERDTRTEYGGYVKALIVKVINEASNHLPQLVKDRAKELFHAIPEHMKVLFAENTDYKTLDGFSAFINKIYYAFSNLINQANQHHAPLPQDLTINIA